MDPSLYEQLSDGQKDCLRLKHRGFLIKEIARKLDIHESSVNDRLSRARRILGAGGSQEAARLLAEHEQQSGTWIPPTGSTNTVSLSPSPPAKDATQTGDGTGRQHLEDSILPGAASAPDHPVDERGIRWPFPTRGRQENDIVIWKRALWVPACAIISLIALLLIAVLTIGLQEVLGDAFSQLLHLE